jgi:acetylcholinesterase
MVSWSGEPFIGISINYRLVSIYDDGDVSNYPRSIGALGFLPSNLSAAEDALNIGLKDQILALNGSRKTSQASVGTRTKLRYLVLLLVVIR